MPDLYANGSAKDHIMALARTAQTKIDNKTKEEFKTWAADVDNFSRQMRDDYTRRGDGWQDPAAFRQYQEEASTKASRLLDGAETYRAFLNRNRSRYKQDALQNVLSGIDRNAGYLSRARNALQWERDYWDQFPDEKSYKKHVADSINKSIDESTARLNALTRERDTLTYDRENGRPYAQSSATRDRLAALPELIQEAKQELDRITAEAERQGIQRPVDDRNMLDKAFDFIDDLTNIAISGLSQAATATYNTLDATVGTAIKNIGKAFGQDWGNNVFSWAAGKANEENAWWQKKLVEAGGNSEAGQVAARLLSQTFAALPALVTAYITGGGSLPSSGSLAATASMATGGMSYAEHVAKTMLTSPDFWMSFSQEAGSNFQEAKAWAKDDNLAALYAVTVGLINSGIEIGLDGSSGIQGLEQAIRDEGFAPLKEFISSIGSEAGEEILQGVVSRGMGKLYGSGAPLYSKTNRDAVFNPYTMAEEGLMGAGVAALLGGGQSVANALYNRSQGGMALIEEVVPGLREEATETPVRTPDTALGAVPDVVQQVPENITENENANIQEVAPQPARQEPLTPEPPVKAPEEEPGLPQFIKDILDSARDKSGNISAEQVAKSFVRAGNVYKGDDARQLVDAYRSFDNGSMGYKYDASDTLQKVNSEDHIDNRGMDDVRAYKYAFQYQNPELHQYFQEAARMMLDDLSHTTPGERTASPVDLSAEEMTTANNYRGGFLWNGTKRKTSNEIAMLKDDYGMSYKEIEDALSRIINNHGQENVAAAKRIEVILDEYLRNGHKTLSGAVFAPNEGYIAAAQKIAGADSAAEPQSDSAGSLPLPTGTGAAEAGFTVRHHGRQVPTQNRTVTHSIDFDEETRQRLAPGTHERVSFEMSQERADRQFYQDENGNVVNLDATVDDLVSKEAWTSEDQVAAQKAQRILLELARETGDYSRVMELGNAIERIGGTEAGRALQVRQNYIGTGNDIINKAGDILHQDENRRRARQRRRQRQNGQENTEIEPVDGDGNNPPPNRNQPDNEDIQDASDDIRRVLVETAIHASQMAVANATANVNEDIQALLEIIGALQNQIQELERDGENEIPVELWLRETARRLQERVAEQGTPQTEEAQQQQLSIMEQMLEDVTRLVRDAAPRAERQGERPTPYTTAYRNLLQNPEAYQGIIDRAQRYLAEQYADNPELLAVFQDWLAGNGMNTDAVVRRAIREHERALGSILEENWERKDRLLRRLQRQLLDGTELTREQAARAAGQIRDSFYTMLTELSQERLARLLPETRDERQRASFFDRFQRFVRLGAFDDAHYAQLAEVALFGETIGDQVMRRVVDFAERYDTAVENGDVNALTDIIWEVQRTRGTGNFWTGEVSSMVRSAMERVVQQNDVDFIRQLAAGSILAVAQDETHVSRTSRLMGYRRMAMLSKVSTIMRNLVSNNVFDPVDTLARDISVPLDILLSRLTGTRSIAVDRSWFSRAKREGSVNGFVRSYLETALDVNASGDGGRLERSNRTFRMSDGPVSRLLSTWEKVQRYAMNSTDELQKGGIQAEIQRGVDALYNRGLIADDSLQDAGRQEALYRTFQDKNRLSNMVLRMREGANNLSVGDAGLGDVVLPFAQVPSNLIARSLEYSPVGLAKSMGSLARVLYRAHRGTLTAAEQARAVQGIGRGLTGSALLQAAVALAANGIIRVLDNGGSDDDKDRAALRRASGEYGTQINLDAFLRWARGEGAGLREGDTLMSIDFLDPFNAILTTGSLIADEWKKTRPDYEKILTDSLSGAAQAIADLPMLDNLQSFYRDIQYSQEENEGRGLIKAALQAGAKQVQSLVPNVARGVATGLDRTQRNTYTSDSLLENSWEALQAAIPGLRQKLPSKQDNYGGDVTYGAEGALHFLNNNILPGSITNYHPPNADVTDWLHEVFDTTGDASIYPDKQAPNSFMANSEKIELSQEEKREYQKSYGNAYLEAARELHESADAFSPERLVELLGEIRSFATANAKQTVLEALGVEYKPTGDAKGIEKALEAVDAGIDFATYYGAKDFYDSLREDRELSAYDKAAEWLNWLDNSDLTEPQQDVMAELLGFTSGFVIKPQASTYTKLKEVGLSDNAAKQVYDTISALEPLKGKTAVSDKQKYEAIVADKTLSDQEKLTAIGYYNGFFKDEKKAKTYHVYKTAHDAGISLSTIAGVAGRMEGTPTQKQIVPVLAEMDRETAEEIYNVYRQVYGWKNSYTEARLSN